MVGGEVGKIGIRQREREGKTNQWDSLGGVWGGTKGHRTIKLPPKSKMSRKLRGLGKTKLVLWGKRFSTKRAKTRKNETLHGKGEAKDGGMEKGTNEQGALGGGGTQEKKCFLKGPWNGEGSKNGGKFTNAGD